MLLRILKHPALLTSLAFHAGIAAAAIYGGHVPDSVSRPALLLGVETREVAGSMDVEALPETPEPPVNFDPIPDIVSDEPIPEDPAEVPSPDAVPVADYLPAFFDAAPIGVRNAVKATSVSVPSASAVPSAPAPAPAPASRRGAYVVTRAAERIGNMPPPYPMEALRHRSEGTAILDVRVTSEGAVSDATIYESSGSRVLDEASIAAASSYRYSPRLVDGVPAPDWLRVPFVWKIQG